MLTLKPSDLRAVSKNRVNFDRHHPHKNHANQSLHLKQVNSGPHTVNFDPSHKNQVNSTPLLKSTQFHPHSKIKPISMPPHEDQFNFDPHTKTKVFFLPPRENQANSDPYTEVNSISIPTLKSSQF